MGVLKLTPWFPADVKPVHVGMYERDWGRVVDNAVSARDYWDGTQWRLGICGKPSSYLMLSDLRWRGLAQKP